MKKYIYKFILVFIVFATISSCKDEQGTEPGNDKNPIVTVYSYAATRPNNPDNDIVLRFATNSKTSECYYLVEKAEDKKTRIASIGEDGYKDYVISKGTKLEGISGVSNVDAIVTDLYGAYTITAVAVGNGMKFSTETTFTGLDWTDVATGTYTFNSKVNTKIKATSNPTTLQVCKTDKNLYRFKDAFGKGYSLKINLIDINGEDSDGKYQFFRVKDQETPFTYSDKGAVRVRDIGYWQKDDAFVTQNGYESGMYEDHSCFIYIQYYVAAGSLGYGYDIFIPN